MREGGREGGVERERKQAGAQTKLVTEVDAACAWTWVRDWGGQGAWHHILDSWGGGFCVSASRVNSRAPEAGYLAAGGRYPWDLSPWTPPSGSCQMENQKVNIGSGPKGSPSRWVGLLGS